MSFIFNRNNKNINFHFFYFILTCCVSYRQVVSIKYNRTGAATAKHRARCSRTSLDSVISPNYCLIFRSRETTQDDEPPGQPCTSETNANIQIISQLIRLSINITTFRL